jgi:hypothetical protein
MEHIIAAIAIGTSGIIAGILLERNEEHIFNFFKWLVSP